jgi:Mg/Co/Ni transporter MgtE
MYSNPDRSVFEDSIQYEDDAVGHYMARELVAVLDTSSVDEVLADLRGELPPQTDRITKSNLLFVLFVP